MASQHATWVMFTFHTVGMDAGELPGPSFPSPTLQDCTAPHYFVIPVNHVLQHRLFREEHSASRRFWNGLDAGTQRVRCHKQWAHDAKCGGAMELSGCARRGMTYAGCLFSLGSRFHGLSLPLRGSGGKRRHSRDRLASQRWRYSS